MNKHSAFEDEGTCEATYTIPIAALPTLPSTVVIDYGFNLLRYINLQLDPSKVRAIVKFVVQQVIRRVNRFPDKYLALVKEPFKPYLGLIKTALRTLRIEDSKKGSEAPVKDYSKTLRKLSIYRPFHYILNEVLKEIREEFGNKSYGKIKMKNVEAYELAINQLYNASQENLSTYQRVMDA